MRSLAALVCLAAVLCGSSAAAQDYPVRPIRAITVTSAGGTSDIFMRALAECKADTTWKTFETTAAGHDVMVDAPEWLVDILLRES